MDALSLSTSGTTTYDSKFPRADSSKYCASEDMIADRLTKGLSCAEFKKLRDMIGIYKLSDSECGGVLKLLTL